MSIKSRRETCRLLYLKSIRYVFGPAHLIMLLLLFFSGWRRVSPTLRRASTGGRTWYATWLTTTSTTGCGRHSSSGAKPTASTSRSSSRCAIAPCSPALPCRARRRSRSSTTSLTLPLASRRRGNPRATSSSTALPPTRDDSLHPTRYVVDGQQRERRLSFSCLYLLPH